MTDTPTLAREIDDLQKRVDKYIPEKRTIGFVSVRKLNMVLPYAAPFVFLPLIFVIIKPKFLIEETLQNNIIKRRIKYKKLLIWTIFLSILIDIGIFLYMRRKSG